MKKLLKVVATMVVLAGLLIAAAGIYKFNYLSGKVGYDVDGNPITLPEPTGKPRVYQTNTGETIAVYALGNEGVEVHFMQSGDDYLKAFTAYRTPSASSVQYVSKDERFTFWAKGEQATVMTRDNEVLFSGELAKKTAAPANETIYFDPNDNRWKDAVGECHTCTPQKGFSADGQVAGAPEKAVWHELFFTLKNDADENPPLAEVQALFANHYSLDPTWYGTHVSQNGDVFRIVVATGHKDTDFTDRAGALMATYIVGEPPIGKLSSQ